MTVQGAQPEREISFQDDFVDDGGYGWIAFAGILLFIVGFLNFIEGIAAISNSKFFVHDTKYIIGSLNTWGWVMLFIGIAQLLIGAGVFAKNQFARWAGVFILGLNAIAQLLLIPAYPFWSLAIFTLDILAIYGLVAYGSRLSSY
ncbi:MAG TPA: hypothetical protein VGF74_02200 [Thermoleophilaceae bacterium]|jgi:hypothetical protein